MDLSDHLSGGWTARLFGDFGAEVILVEDETGNPLRHEPPFLVRNPGSNRSLLRAYVNWKKRSTIASEDVLRELISNADVVVTTSVGLPKELSSLSSNAVHWSITPHSLAGPIA